MKNFAYLLALPAAILISACSGNDDNAPNGGNVSSNAVRFNVTVPRASRIPTTTASIDHFRIFSFVDQKPYMQNVIANRNESNWVTSPIMYWPADETPVNFYCVSPMLWDKTGSGVPNPNIEDFNNPDGNTDLLYSVTIGATENPVNINFRHALSKIQFNFKRRAATAEAPIKVDVKEVALTDIKGTGSFTFPDRTTAPNTEDTGTWHDQGNPSEVIIYSNSTTTLTDTYQTLSSTDYEFAIPQTLAESRVDMSGAYVRVNCSIYDENSGVRIWPKGAEEGSIYFPLNSPGASNTTSTWLPGKAYAYNLTIGVPAGTDKIQFDVTVDTYPAFEDMYVQ